MVLKQTPPSLISLVLTTALGALSLSVLLPTFPELGKHFEVNKQTVQMVVSIYLIATAFIQPLIGPLSDYFGRRPTLLVCIAIFVAGSLIALTANSFFVLLVGRVVQAFSIAGLVTARAVVRDIHAPERAASQMGYITMGMAMVPMVGPFIGGLLTERWGWQSPFTVLVGFGLCVIILAWIDYGETRKSAASSLSQQFKSYPQLVRSRRFWAYTGVAAFSSGAFFSILGGGPYVANEYLGIAPSEFGAWFGMLAIGYFFGNMFSGLMSEKLGMSSMMLLGNLVMIIAITVAIGFISFGFRDPLAFFLPLAFIGLGNGISLPSANAGIVSVRPNLAGAASGLGGSSMTVGGALLSVLSVYVLPEGSNPLSMLWVMLATGLAAVMCTIFVIILNRIDPLVAAREAA